VEKIEARENPATAKRNGASPPDDFADAAGYLFARNALDLAALDFLDTPVNFASPGGFGFRVASVQIFGQAADQFSHFIGRPMAGFFNKFVPLLMARPGTYTIDVRDSMVGCADGSITVEI